MQILPISTKMNIIKIKIKINFIVKFVLGY